MTWFRTDDGFPEHPKADRLAEYFGDQWQLLNLAFAAWHHIGCDCAARRTDGVFNSARAYRVMRAPRTAVDKAIAGLVAAGLVKRIEDGFVFHDWAEYQPTKAQLDSEREAKNRRMARWRAGKSFERDGHVDASHSREDSRVTPSVLASRRSGDGDVDASTDASVDAQVTLAPSRPVPSHKEKTQREQSNHSEKPNGSVASATLSLLPDEEAPKAPRDIDRVFAHWQTATNHTRAVLDAKRERAIRSALKSYSVADLCRSIDGYARSPFHQGQNNTGARHDDITLIVRDATHVEAGWSLATKHAPAPRPAPPPPPAPRPATAPRVTAEEVRAMRAALAPVAPKEVSQ